MASSVFFGASSEDIWGNRQRPAKPERPGDAERRCSRPTCSAIARATLSFDYAQQRAVLTGLVTDITPELYDLCDLHAERTSPPLGWKLTDDRFTGASQERIFSDEAQALSALIDDMKRTSKPRR
jgi:hypothetical protein